MPEFIDFVPEIPSVGVNLAVIRFNSGDVMPVADGFLLNNAIILPDFVVCKLNFGNFGLILYKFQIKNDIHKYDTAFERNSHFSQRQYIKITQKRKTVFVLLFRFLIGNKKLLLINQKILSTSSC